MVPASAHSTMLPPVVKANLRSPRRQTVIEASTTKAMNRNMPKEPTSIQALPVPSGNRNEFAEERDSPQAP